MTTEDRIEALFHGARGLCEADLRAYLDRGCGDDVDLRERVDRLLRADAEAQRFLADAAPVNGDGGTGVDVDGDADGEASIAEGPGTVIGRYRLVREIGAGGFGIVFLAHQSEPVERDVALKIVKAGMDTRQVLARFATERRTLALMDHPNIAGVLDAGATETGRPYFVMPLVDGPAITQYAGAHDLDLRTRLGLFRLVCAGVQHAHQKGAIHRDLKPSNILVSETDGVPVPRVIDFGIAKATAREAEGQTAVTREGQLVGTPQYMSPEQAGLYDADIDTRADVYALGVVLYELLTGTTPLDPESLRSIGPAELHDVICTTPTPRPSTRATGSEPGPLREVDAPLRRELDWIVLKALEKDRDRRYGTVAELSADIGRYLAHEPVLAGPPSTAYRVRKFVRRNRVAVVAAATVVLVLCAGIASTGIALARTLAAERQLKTTNATLDDIVSFQAARLREIDPARMGVDLRNGLRDQARAAIATTAESPATVEAAMAELEDLLAGTNFTSVALEAIRSNLIDDALATADRQFADDPGVHARLLQTIATTMIELGLPEAAEDPQTRALDIRRRLLGDDHADTLESVAAMAAMLKARGRLDDALPYAREALDGDRRVLGPDDPRTVDALNNWGVLAWSRGELDEAERTFHEALDTYARVQGEDDVAALRTHGNIGGLLQVQGRYDEAEPHFRRAYEGLLAQLGPEAPYTLAAQYNLALLLSGTGEYEEAEMLAREALAGFRRTQGDDHPETIAAINLVGTVIHGQQRLEDALPFIEEALERRRRLLGDGHMETIASMSNLGAVFRDLGRPEDAEPYGAEAVAIGRRVLPPNHWVLGVLLMQHARTLSHLERYADAARELLEAEPMVTSALGDRHAYTREAWELLADIHASWDRVEPDAGHGDVAAEWRARFEAVAKAP